MKDIENCLFMPMKLVGQMEHVFGGSVHLCRPPDDIRTEPGLIVPVVDGGNGLAEGWMAEGFCRGRAYLAIDAVDGRAVPRFLDDEEFPYNCSHGGFRTSGFPELALVADGDIVFAAADGARVPLETWDSAKRMVLKADIVSRITCDFGDVLDFLELEDGMILDDFSLDILKMLRERLTRSSDYFKESMAVTASGAISGLVTEVLAAKGTKPSRQPSTRMETK